ncbi:hypothetical protein CcaCcLH18_09430 [Colletotrichum camelliae]|nr:hypothetical protein CcaCcLH18_09430 [Colletotrichum camelliae]
MSSSKTLTPPLDEGSPQLKFYRMERPTGQLFELKEMQKQQLTALDEADEAPPPPGPPPMAPPPPPPPPPFENAERGLREFNYNGRDIKPRNSERSSGALGRHRDSSYSIYSDYSSHPSSDDGRRGDDGGRRDAVNAAGGGGGGSVPQVQHGEHPPRRNLGMKAAPPTHSRSTSGNSRGSGRGGGVVVSQPPPTYAPSRELYNRVRFAEQERIRREESRAPGPRRIEMVDVVGGPSVGAMWVFACCYFFWYRCLMDEDF